MSGEANKVKPQTLKGFQDLMPETMIRREMVAEKVKKVYEKFGFQPIDTPVVEHLEALVGTGGEETNKELFRFESPEGDPVAMRYDLTVPLARIVAQYQESLKMPFRRYHFGPVFRADKPSFGRFRQFLQFDIDVVGTDSVAADAEIIAAMSEVMTEVGLENSTEQKQYEIHINNRRLMDALLEGCNIEDIEVQKHVLRVIDKLKKVGLDNVRRELGKGRVDDSGDPIRGVGLDEETIEKVLAFIAVKGEDRASVLQHIADVLPESEASEKALAEMKNLSEFLDALGVGQSDAVFDPSLARGLDYYTGPVYEAILLEAPEFGSVMGGGRYDGLVERFSDSPMPGTGASIGFDRFVSALDKLGKLPEVRSKTHALIISLGDVPGTALLGAAKELRDNGVIAEIYLSQRRAGMKVQMSYANHRGIPVAVILGEDEVKAGKVSVKDLEAGFEKREGIQNREAYRKAGKVGQVTVARSEMLATVKNILEG